MSLCKNYQFNSFLSSLIVLISLGAIHLAHGKDDVKPSASNLVEVNQPDIAGTAVIDKKLDGVDKEGVAKQLANPLANIVTLPFQWNYDQKVGQNNSGSAQSLLFQPAIPISLEKGDIFFLRPIITIQQLNNVNGFTGAGVSSIQLEAFYAPYTGSPFLWGVGPYLTSPAGSSGHFGSQQTGAGVNAVVVDRRKNWTYGLLGYQSWSVGGVPTTGTANNIYAQPFISYVTKDALTYSVNFQSTYNYDMHRMANPINFDISKIELVERVPIQFTIGARYHLSSFPGCPQGWGARTEIVIVLPK